MLHKSCSQLRATARASAVERPRVAASREDIYFQWFTLASSFPPNYSPDSRNHTWTCTQLSAIVSVFSHYELWDKRVHRFTLQPPLPDALHNSREMENALELQRTIPLLFCIYTRSSFAMQNVQPIFLCPQVRPVMDQREMDATFHFSRAA